MANIAQTLARDRDAPKWRTYAGKSVVVHALEGSYASRQARAELREADAAVEALDNLLAPKKREGAGHAHAEERINIYLSDPLVDLAAVQARLAEANAVVRIIEPE